MNDVQRVLEELTGLLDVFLQGLVEHNIVSGYSLSLATCPDIIEPSAHTLPQFLLLLKPLQQGIKELLLQYYSTKIICEEPRVDQETQGSNIISPQVQAVENEGIRIAEEISCESNEENNCNEKSNQTETFTSSTSESFIESEKRELPMKNSDISSNHNGDDVIIKNCYESRTVQLQNQVDILENIDDNSLPLIVVIPSLHEDISQIEQDDQLEPSHLSVPERSGDIQQNTCHEKEKITKTKTKKEIHECPECHREFKSASTLTTHRIKVHTMPQCCDLCGQMLGSTSALQEHCRNVHGGVGCFQCSMCKKRFMLLHSYRRHLDTHEQVSTAVCEICGKSFKRTDYLQRHYLTHTGEKPHICNICGKRFTCKSHLKTHITIHSDVRAHGCNICGRGFARPDKLKEHMRRHLNVKKHVCDDCGKVYAERRDLKKHLERCQERANNFIVPKVIILE